jgi:hypothetical protein
MALGLSVSPLRAEGPAPEQPRPTVYALLAIQHQRPRLPAADAPPRERVDEKEFEAYRRTQAVLIKSRPVLTAALKREGVGKLSLLKQQPDPVGWLEENLKVDFPENAPILRLSLSGDKHDELAVLVNAVASAYLEEVVANEQREQVRRLAKLDDVFSRYEEKVRNQRERLRRLAEVLGIPRAEVLSDQGQALREEQADVRKELRRVRLARVAVEARLRLPPAKDAEETEKKLRGELAVLEAQEKLLAEEVQQLERVASRTAKSLYELQLLQEDIATAEAIYKQLRVEKQHLEIELLQALPRVKLLQEAMPSKKN